MRIPPPVLLFLALVLIPDPGVSQFGAQGRICKDCGKIEANEDPTKLNELINKVTKYAKCPHTDNIRFTLKTQQGPICAKNYLSWVTKLKACLDAKTCLDDASSSSRKEFSKGTNLNPSTTTTNTPTTAPVTSMKPSTQSQDQNIGQSTEPAAPAVLNTTPLDSNKENLNLAQGKDQSIEPQNAGDQHSKIKHMQTIIISLIVIILVAVAIFVGVFCQRKKANKISTLCGSRPLEYTTAPSEDSFKVLNVDS
ncbi:uncharacterized protein LOC120933444 [Rana temporaria]|uniref:uncharacterized protein LOC120933444 n=1 Tax=Rana temporaria TaxID=8407 RepID=UPI001AACC68C|nr:uncharacterized protein LOC120933444 [Rana temporaria]XP_040202597.1 uncharacterized protein LOC120933444 [Rana temporaria]XP_040202598.1 uncharacterized protein LOC120933444 [Rana temporaria]